MSDNGLDTPQKRDGSGNVAYARVRKEDFMTDLHEYVETNCGNICQIVALKNGKTVLEDYFHGFKPDDTLHVMSVTKSVVSLLVGIAIDKGLIKNIDCPVLDFFPDYRIKRGEKTLQSVTIRHLLTMTAPYKYRSEPWTKICTSPDWAVAALDFIGGKEGITDTFRYSTLGIHVLTGILVATSGLQTVDFANEYLFAPLGIERFENYETLTAEEHKTFMLSKEPKKRVWFVDPNGVGTAGYGLCISARDMAKIGQLCLDGGIYDDKRVVSAEWIKESTAPRLQCDETFGNMRYGYLWWTPDVDRSAYAALGNSGNAIYINPENNSVVTVTGTFKPNIFDRVRFIREHVEPLLTEVDS